MVAGLGASSGVAALAVSVLGFAASATSGCVASSFLSGENIHTAATPAIRLNAAAVTIPAFRRVGWSPNNAPTLPVSVVGVNGIAGAANGGFAGSGFGAACAGRVPSMDGGFAGKSTAIGSIREPSSEE